MAHTISKVDQVDVGLKEELVLDITGDASYPAGGYPVTIADFPFRVGQALDHLHGRTADGSGRTVEYDTANAKLLWREPAGAEVAALTDLSAVTVRCRALGR